MPNVKTTEGMETVLVKDHLNTLVASARKLIVAQAVLHDSSIVLVQVRKIVMKGCRKAWKILTAQSSPPTLCATSAAL